MPWLFVTTRPVHLVMRRGGRAGGGQDRDEAERRPRDPGSGPATGCRSFLSLPATSVLRPFGHLVSGDG